MTMKSKEIKSLVKESLSIRCAPKSLNAFYLFHHTYNNNTISGYSFVSTSILKNRLGYTKSSTYQKYFDAWVEEMSDEYVMGETCRKITKWTPAFIKLMTQTKDIKIPQSFYEQMYWNTMKIEHDNLNLLKTLFNTINNNTDSGYSFEELYHQTKTSSFRWYNSMQNLPTEIKRIMFKDMWDVDIDSCFSSICYHELGIKDERLNPALKQEFRSWVQKELGLDSIQEAKQVVSRLFTGKHTKYNKIQWYDELFNKINKAVWNEIKSLQQSHPEIQWSHHQYFTHMEQRIINKVLPVVNLVLRMHDGFICAQRPDMEEVNRLAYPHRLTDKKI